MSTKVIFRHYVDGGVIEIDATELIERVMVENHIDRRRTKVLLGAKPKPVVMNVTVIADFENTTDMDRLFL